MVPGQDVLTPVTGTVSKIGYAYSEGIGSIMSENPFRYVEVTTLDRYRVRVMYIDPYVETSDVVIENRFILGAARDLRERYGPEIQPHIHREVINPDGEYVNPEEALSP